MLHWLVIVSLVQLKNRKLYKYVHESIYVHKLTFNFLWTKIVCTLLVISIPSPGIVLSNNSFKKILLFLKKTNISFVFLKQTSTKQPVLFLMKPTEPIFSTYSISILGGNRLVSLIIALPFYVIFTNRVLTFIMNIYITLASFSCVNNLQFTFNFL